MWIHRVSWGERFEPIAPTTGWRKRVGVEPTIRLAKSRIAGFEGREDHRTPCASAVVGVIVAYRLRGSLAGCGIRFAGIIAESKPTPKATAKPKFEKPHLCSSELPQGKKR